jgi:hypothetical protein
MAVEGTPRLSLPAALELRRIFVKHLDEVMISPETHELWERGLIQGHLSTQRASFVVEAVTPLGLELLAARDGR